MPVEVLPLLLAALGGTVIGLLLTLFGGGGSVLAAPMLIYAVGVTDPHVAIGTSAVAVTLNAVSALAVQARAGQVKWPCASVFAIAGLAGALLGAHLAKQIEGQTLLLAFAVVMMAVGISMLLPRRVEGDPGVHLTAALTRKLTPVGFATGLGAGFFGIGGGFLIAPGLMAATGMTLSNAAASSLVSVTLFGAATSASYAVSSFVDWALAAAMVAGGIGGVWIGARTAPHLANHAVLARRIFAGLIIATAAYVAWRAVAAL